MRRPEKYRKHVFHLAQPATNAYDAYVFHGKRECREFIRYAKVKYGIDFEEGKLKMKSNLEAVHYAKRTTTLEKAKKHFKFAWYLHKVELL